MLAAVCGGAIVVGALGMKAGQTDSDPGSAPRERALSMDGDISCCQVRVYACHAVWCRYDTWCLAQSLQVMKRVDFWLLFLSNIVGIGGGVFIVTSLAQVWDNFSSPSEKVWGRRIVIMFSVCNAVGNVVSPIVSERLHRQGKMRRSTFTAWVLGAMAVIFSALGTFTVVPGLRDGPWACDVAYIALMASVGFGYGSFLTLFPTLVAETYGLRYGVVCVRCTHHAHCNVHNVRLWRVTCGERRLARNFGCVGRAVLLGVATRRLRAYGAGCTGRMCRTSRWALRCRPF